MSQCHVATFRTCSPLVLLHLVLFLRFISPPQQFRIQFLKLAFPMRFLFICFCYASIHIWLHTRTIDPGGDLEKNSGPGLVLRK